MDDHTVTALSITLEERRQVLRLTQPEVADTIGVAPRTIRRWETSASIPRDARHIASLAVFLGIDAAQVGVLAGTRFHRGVSTLLARMELLHDATRTLAALVEHTANDLRRVIRHDHEVQAALDAYNADGDGPRQVGALAGRR